MSPSRPAFPPGMQVLERGWLSSNSVLFSGPDGTALVDSGYWTHAPTSLALVSRALGGRALDRLLNTHLHSDHCGGNAALQAAYPALRTSIPPGLADAVARWDSEALGYEPTGQQCPRFQFVDLLVPGREVRRPRGRSAFGVRAGASARRRRLRPGALGSGASSSGSLSTTGMR